MTPPGSRSAGRGSAAPGPTWTPQGPGFRVLGKRVCFTGTLMGRLGGEAISRERAHRLAEAAGLVVRDRVTKDLDILVVADPHTLDSRALEELDRLVRAGAYPSRSRAIEAAIKEKLERLGRSRLARESAKLDPAFERALAEEGMSEELAAWPGY